MAMAALEREAGVVSTKGEGGKGSPADGDPVVDFASFVASVRAVLLFEGENLKASSGHTVELSLPASLSWGIVCNSRTWFISTPKNQARMMRLRLFLTPSSLIFTVLYRSA